MIADPGVVEWLEDIFQSDLRTYCNVVGVPVTHHYWIELIYDHHPESSEEMPWFNAPYIYKSLPMCMACYDDPFSWPDDFNGETFICGHLISEGGIQWLRNAQITASLT